MEGIIFVIALPFCFQYFGNKRARYLISDFLESQNMHHSEIEISLFFGTTSFGVNELVPNFKCGLFNGRDWVLKILLNPRSKYSIWVRIPLYSKAPLKSEDIIFPDGSSWAERLEEIKTKV